MKKAFFILNSVLSVTLSVLVYQYYAVQAPSEPVILSVMDTNVTPYRPQSADNTMTFRPDGDGHFRINTQINGKNIKMLFDTGASMVALSRGDAEKLGFHYQDSDFNRSGKSATGQVNFIEINLPQVTIQDIVLYNIPAAVINQKSMPPLLGMSLISKELKKAPSGT